jgi:Competence protein
LKNGNIKLSHFAHKNLATCKYLSENESLEHLTLKKMIYDANKNYHKVELEAFQRNLQQIPDILVESKIALEVQCSSLSLKRLKERTDTYLENGYKVVWMMGENLHLKERMTKLQENLTYFSRNLGFYYWELHLKKRLIRLKYMIHRDLKGELIYLQVDFPLDGDIIDTLRYPFKARKADILSISSDRRIYDYLAGKLFHKDKKMMEIQEIYYMKGLNFLRDADLNLQIAPLGLDILKSQISLEYDLEFIQIADDLKSYYNNFMLFYQKRKNKKQTLLYPPAFYDKMVNNT